MKFLFGGKGSKGQARRTNERVRQPRLMEGQDAYTFRRSRTLTGSLSNQVTPTRAQRPDLKSERIKLHELHQHRRLLKTSLASLAVLGLVATFLLFNSVALAQKHFGVQNNIPAADRTALEATISTYINQHPSEAFFFTLNTQQLTRFMQASHPEVHAVTINNAWQVGAGVLQVEFRQPIVVWKIQNDRFFVDEDGTAFTIYYGKEPALKVEDASGFTPEIAKQQSVASRRFIGYLGQLLGALKTQQVGVVERVVIPASTRQLDVYIKGRGYAIKTHIDRDPYAQAEDIKNALKFLDSKQIKPQYVDVRVEGKAFYK